MEECNVQEMSEEEKMKTKCKLTNQNCLEVYQARDKFNKIKNFTKGALTEARRFLKDLAWYEIGGRKYVQGYVDALEVISKEMEEENENCT